MRTTITFDDDVAAAVRAYQRERGTGISEAVNQLVRRGLVRPHARTQVNLAVHDVGLLVDVTNVEDALDAIEGVDRAG